MANPASTNRGYFRPTKGMISGEAEWNTGLIDKIDSDVQQVTDNHATEQANHQAVKRRIDAVVSDEGSSSRILRPVREFRPFSTGESPYDPGNTPRRQDAGTFLIAGDWTSEFTPNRRLRVVSQNSPVVYVFVWLATYVGPDMLLAVYPGVVPADVIDLELSRMQYGHPAVTGSRIKDGTLTEAKLAFDPATQAELDAMQSQRQGEVTQLESDEQQFESDLATHGSATTGVHGAGSGDALLGEPAMQSRISTHDASSGAHLAAAFAGIERRVNKGQPNGYVPLDASGQVDGAYLPAGLGIKSVQEIADSLAAGIATKVHTISAVDPSKAFVTIQVAPQSSGASGGVRAITAELTNGTTVTVTRDLTNYQADYQVTVTEFN